MKKYIYLLLLTSLIITSCADEELGPVLTFEKATIGSYIRLVELFSGEFDLENTATTALDYEVDFVDIDNGNGVVEYIIDAQFVDNTPGNGDNSKAAIEYTVITDFTESRNGNVGARVQIPLLDLLSSFGLSIDEVSASDQFSFFGRVETEDGQRYGSDNSTSTVRGSAFQGYFDFSGKLTCPQGDDRFVGDYVLSYEGDAGLGYGPPYEEGITVTISTITGSTTLRSFESLVLPAIGGFGPYTNRFDLVCDQAVFELMDSSPLGCGGGGIMFGPARDDNNIPIGAPLDLSDDSVIRLIINEGFASGGCAGQTGDTQTTIVLTKQ